MLKKMIRHLLARRGFALTRVPQGYAPDKAYVLHRYLRADGSFDYDAYKRIQTDGNKQKIDQVWARQENIEFLASQLRQRIGQPAFGLCHGTRRGLEQRWFADTLGCEFLGTEISDSANDFPNTVKWDFHDTKPEWIDAVDIVYSNSFDHSYDPEKCLNAWMSCVRPGGLCVIDHSAAHGRFGVSDLDPFGAELDLMPYLICRWGKGRYAVREILDVPKRSPKLSYHAFLLIQRFDASW